MSDSDARDAACAACERGLELVRERGLELRIAQEPGLIRLFALGWRAQREVSPSRQPKRAQSAR